MVFNTIEPALLGHKVLELAADRKNMVLGFATAAGLLVALLSQPVVGALSDRVRSRWGRRLPILFIGTLLVVVALPLTALSPSLAALIPALLMVYLATNIAQAPTQALIPDLVPERQRGIAAGFKATYDILGLVLGRLISGELVALGRVTEAAAASSAVFLLASGVTALAAREPSSPPPMDLEPIIGRSPKVSAGRLDLRGIWRATRRAYSIDWRAHPGFIPWFINRGLFWGAFVALNTFLLFYMMDVVGMEEAVAQRFIARMFPLIGVAIMLVNLPSGWLADRVGRRPMLVLAGLLASGGTGMVLFLRSPLGIVAAGLVIGLGIGIFLSANWAMITDIVPPGEAARYLGIANMAAASGSFLARFAGGALIDPVNRMMGSQTAGYLTLYVLTLLAFVVATAAVSRLPGRKLSP